MSRVIQHPKDLFLLSGISCLVFNKDFTQCALSKKDNHIYIYQVKDISKPMEWKEIHKLSAHVQKITGLDWNVHTNSIVSSSIDKTCYVWNYESNKWVSYLLVATTKLGFLNCSWNDRGDKFCTGTSSPSKNLFICYYDINTKWWASLHLKKAHKSSVLCCKFDPTSLYVISGGADNRIVVASCYYKDIDDSYLTEETKPLVKEFGTIVYTIEASSWINSVGWNSTGSVAYAAGQDGKLYFIDYKNNKNEELQVNHSPVNTIIPNGENNFFVICYDRNIYEYQKDGEKFGLKKTITGGNALSKDESKGAGKDASMGSGGGVAEALKKFSKMGFQKKESLAVTTTQNELVHPAAICSVSIKGNTLITVDLAGFLKNWKI